MGKASPYREDRRPSVSLSTDRNGSVLEIDGYTITFVSQPGTGVKVVNPSGDVVVEASQRDIGPSKKVSIVATENSVISGVVQHVGAQTKEDPLSRIFRYVTKTAMTVSMGALFWLLVVRPVMLALGYHVHLQKPFFRGGRQGCGYRRAGCSPYP